MGEVNGNANVDVGKEVNRSALNAAVHEVMAVGNAACKKALPTSAGLNGLYPKPPKINLPRDTAMTPPANVIHNGKPGGRVSPYIMPVITTDQSLTVVAWRDHLHNKCSVNMQERIPTRRVSNAANPKA